MKNLVLRTGFVSEAPIEYKGENIFKVVETRENLGLMNYRLENNLWVTDYGNDIYQTEWNAEEFWGKLEDADTGDFVGFVLLHVDRKNNVRLIKPCSN